MSAKTKAGKPAKITIQVWRPIWSKLEKKLEAACLRRDAYIGKLVEKELDYLEEEMPIANSEAAEKFIDSQFRALQDFTPLSIALKPETAARLVQVCSSKRIVRDSFFNRLFLFIAFGPQMAGKLLFLGIDDGIGEWRATNWTRIVWSERKHDGPFFDNVFDPFQAVEDPIWPIRACIDEINSKDTPECVDWLDPETKKTVQMVRTVPEHLLKLPYRFYTAVLTDHALRKAASTPRLPTAKGNDQSGTGAHAYHNLYGLNCYLPNHHVKGHPDQKAVEDLLSDL